MKIEIKEGTKEIESKKYLTEYAVTEFVLPKSVEKIGESAFSVYTDMQPTLKKFTVNQENDYFDTIDGVLVTKDHKKLVSYPIGRQEKYVVPEGIEEIGKSAFRMGIYLEEIILPKSLKKIEKGAFYYCKNLKKVDFGDAHVVIKANAFEKCESLSDIEGSMSICAIDKKAFIKCKSLKKIHFGKAIKSIGDEAFYGVEGTHFVFEDVDISFGNKAFAGKNISMDIHEKQEKSIIPEIFAINDVRKFHVAVCLLDQDNRTVELEGKLGEGNHNIQINEGRLVTDESTKVVKKVKKAEGLIIRPTLLDEVEGSISGKDIQSGVAGFYYKDNILINTYDNGYRTAHDFFSSILWIEQEKIKHLDISKYKFDFEWYKGKENDGNENLVRRPVHLQPYIDIRYRKCSDHTYLPYAYRYNENEILVDFTVFVFQNPYSIDGKRDKEIDDANDRPIEEIRILKINIDGSKPIEMITNAASDEYKFIMENNIRLKNHYNNVKYIINFDEEGFSKETYKKCHKYQFGNFLSPDEEESLSFFWQDQQDRIFNYGGCVVYNESQKAHLSVRNRSFINVYNADDSKLTTVKFVGVPVHIEQKENEYYVLTQQDCDLPRKSKVRLYKFKI